MLINSHPNRERGESTLTVCIGAAWLFRFILFITAGFSRPVDAAADQPAYQGAARCIDCHTRPNPLRQKDGTTD